MVCSDCCAADQKISEHSTRWRRALWIALAINLVMFASEVFAGIAGHSRALLADALDFLGDAANYAISLIVVTMALFWRARAAMLKGATLALLGSYILASTLWAFWHGQLPKAEVMGLVGMVALLANGGVALMLYRFRDGDANMRSVWICSRNDAIGNVAVLLAAMGVFGMHSALPDLAVAAIMAGLGISGGVQIMRHAWTEIAQTRVVRV